MKLISTLFNLVFSFAKESASSDTSIASISTLHSFLIDTAIHPVPVHTSTTLRLSLFKSWY